VRLAIGLVPVWLLATLAGMAVLVDYEVTPGAESEARQRWPEASAIPRSAERPALIVAAHPRCPCTQATLGELEILLAQAGERLDAHVVFVQPAGKDAAWVRETPLYREAAAISGVSAHVDSGGEEAQRFGTFTSGATLFYDVTGELLFRGGLTGSRGHQGDNAGRASLLALALGEAPERRETFVFGCSLWSRWLGSVWRMTPWRM
jgi:hypothetical protein